MAEFQTDSNLIAGYVSDESGLPGSAEGICFPKSGDEAAQALRQAHLEGLPVTVQGARTGYRGQAVPHGGVLLNLSRMDRLLAFRFDPEARTASVTVEAGMTLDALNQTLRAKCPVSAWAGAASGADADSGRHWDRYRASDLTLFFPPNPTEGSATLGGILATGASGSHIHAYGDVLRQAEQIQRVRGSEGGPEVITACTLKLAVRPAHTYALFAFGPDYPALLDFLARLARSASSTDARLTGADFFDRSCFRLAQARRARVPALSRFPSFPAVPCAGLCLELSAQSEDALFPLLEAAMDAMEASRLQTEDTVVAATAQEAARMQSVRHLLTEAANTLTLGRPKRILEGTLPAGRRGEYPGLLTRLSDALDASGLPGLLFGHAGVGNFHLRLVPEDEAQERLAAQLIADPTLGPASRGRAFGAAVFICCAGSCGTPWGTCRCSA